jgi:UPF0716 family protein affecting phage T7 exclusion
MTVGQIVFIAVGGVILAIISGLVTRNIVVAILFPILLIGFLLMWRKIQEEAPSKPREDEKKGEEEKGEIIATKNEVEVKVTEDQNQNQPQPTPQVQNRNPQVNNYQQPIQNPSQPPVSTNYPPRQSLR